MDTFKDFTAKRQEFDRVDHSLPRSDSKTDLPLSDAEKNPDRNTKARTDIQASKRFTSQIKTKVIDND